MLSKIRPEDISYYAVSSTKADVSSSLSQENSHTAVPEAAEGLLVQLQFLWTDPGDIQTEGVPPTRSVQCKQQTFEEYSSLRFTAAGTLSHRKSCASAVSAYTPSV